ncbi:D-amino-acid oxidase [Penicillium rolfsii]|nr:D-amino-acid oxidase [Penicillium rolfsii]
MSKGQVIIVGAGVLGLSCAVQLSRSGHSVTVIARDLPGDSHIDYASPWAGAHFRPSPAKTAAEQLEQRLMRDTYSELEILAKEHPESGVKIVPAIEYFDSADAESFLAKENGYIDWPDFRILKSEEYPPHHDSIRLGVTYRSWVLNSPVYLQWCQKQAEERGVQFVRASIASMDEAVFVFQQKFQESEGSDIRAVINATGRGLDDPDSFPSRGQFIIVSNQCDETISHHWADGSSTVIIPRPLGGGTVIGGTKEPNNWSEDISDAATETILKRVVGICPQLIDQKTHSTGNAHGLDIRQVYIARRPMRRGGLRLEKDKTNEGIPLIHCYGAGASGFKISWGVARQVELLVANTELLVSEPLEIL